MAPVRLAVLGAGRWGRNYIRTIPQVEGAALAVVASKNAGTAKLVPAGCKIVADWREALFAADVDAVVVSTPSSTHAEVALAALAADRPVLLEKPAALTSADARRILDEARRRKLHVLVDHTLLFHPAYGELKKRATGKLELLEGVGGNAGPVREDASGLWDYGPHDVAAALDLFGGDPERVTAALEGENYRLDLDFGEERKAELFVGNNLPAKKRLLTAHWGKHVCVMDDLSNHKLVCDGKPVATAPELPLTRCVQTFVSNLQAGSTDASSLELGVRVVEVLERCEKALP